MIIRRLITVSRSKRVALLAITLATMMCISSYSLLAASAWKVSSVELTGLSGVTNNVAFAYDRYVLVAPYAPSKTVEDNLDLSQLDNSFLYLIDTKKPSEGIQKVELKSYDSTDTARKTVYYPSRVMFDSETSTVYLRGTRFEQKDGELQEIEVLAYLRLNLDDDGKPIFNSNVVIIDIKGLESNYCDEAPLDFALARKGSLLLFTNGASIFSYNIDKGYVYKVDIVPTNYFNENSRISYLDVDKTTDTLIVCWNTKEEGEDGVKVSSELSFYSVDIDGTLPLKKRAYSYGFVDGTALTDGSTVAISSTLSKERPDELVPVSAYFVTDDGSLCQIELDSEGIPATVKQLRKFDELAEAKAGDGSPRIIKYDASNRVIGIVKQGFRAQIRRPTNGRPGRRGSIVRALNASAVVEQPAIALVKFGKKNKITSTEVFADEFNNEVGLSNLAYGRGSQWLVSTHSGKLYALGLGGDSAETRIQKLGEIGSRIDRIDFSDTRGSVVAINSYESDKDGSQIIAPGSLVIAKMGDSTGQSFNARLLQALKSPGEVFGAVAPTIRRPCNVKR
jgi:hypothetical protein